MYILSVIPIKALIQMKDMYGLRLDEHHGLGRVEYFETVDDQSNPLSTILTLSYRILHVENTPACFRHILKI